MNEYSIEEIRKKVLELSKDQEWNHCYDLQGVRTRVHDINSPGYNVNKWRRLKPMMGEISGKKILDVGSSDGFFSIQCAQLGAESVLGIEIDDVRVKRANLVKSILSIENVAFEAMDLYKLSNENKFDIIMALGMLHRVPDINEMLQKMSELADELVLEYKSYQKDEDCCFDGKEQMKDNKYNKLYQVPTDFYVENRLRELGFSEFIFDKDNQSHLIFKRSICIAKK